MQLEEVIVIITLYCALMEDYFALILYLTFPSYRYCEQKKRRRAMMLQACGKMLADTGVMDDTILPKLHLPFADSVAKTCAAVKDKLNRSAPYMKQSAVMAGASLVLSTGGAFTLSHGVAIASEGSLYAIGIGILLAVGSAHSFWQGIKA